MALRKGKTLFILVGLSAIAVLAVAGFIWSGLYNIGADDPHTGPVYSALEMLRERSIEVRASKLQVPNLDDPARILQGSGNYAAMCTGCHLAPGMPETEMSRGLYPAPPDLTRHTVDAAEAFWAIKHGIKASGMPAWGKSMVDEYIWNMAAFLQVLPTLNAAEYHAMVASSGGHSHGGGETQAHAHGEDADHHGNGGETPHVHPPGTPADHHESEAQQDTQPQMIEHQHADGTVESHPARRRPRPNPVTTTNTTTDHGASRA